MVSIGDLFINVKNIFKSNKQNNRNQQKNPNQNNPKKKNQKNPNQNNPKQKNQKNPNQNNPKQKKQKNPNQKNPKQNNPNKRTYVQSSNYNGSVINNKSMNDPVIIPRNNQRTVTFSNQVTIKQYTNNNKTEPIINNQDFELLKRRYINKNNKINEKKKRRVNVSNINVNQIIKQNLIPIIVDKLIKKKNNSSYRIIQKKFYIKPNKTFKNLKDIIENRINITNTIKINIKLLILTEDNKTTEIKDEDTLMSTIYETHKHKDGFLYMVYTVLGEKFTMV